MYPKQLLLSVSLSALMAAPALAADMPSSSRLDAVTLFPRGAELTRFAEVTLEPGSHTLIFSDLPDRILPNSVRVEGQSDAAGLAISSIDTQRIFLDSEAISGGEYKKLKDRIEALQDKRKRLDVTIRTAETQLNLLQNLATLPTVPPAAGGSAPAPDWNTILTLIGGMDEVQTRILGAREGQRELDRQIEELNKQLSLLNPGRTARTRVKVFIAAKAAGKALFRIRYQIRNGGWQPFYDLRLNTGAGGKGPDLELVRRASISQSSGEDWQNIEMALSTTRPQSGTSAPNLRPNLVRYRQPVIAYRKQAPSKARRRMVGAMPEMADAMPAPMAAGAAAPKPVMEQEASVESYAFQAVYRIPGRVSIKSGAAAKKLRIDAARPELKLNVRAVPALDSTAYLYADITWNGKTGLLPGRASLYRDGAFSGTGALPLVNPGDSHEIGFGADDKVKVKRIQQSREKSVTGLLSSSNVDERDYLITVENLHGQKVPVSIFDRVPYSEDEDIEVNLLAKTTPPSRKNPDGKRGVMAWDFGLDAGGKKEIRLNYRISWPKKKAIEFVTR